MSDLVKKVIRNAMCDVVAGSHLVHCYLDCVKLSLKANPHDWPDVPSAGFHYTYNWDVVMVKARIDSQEDLHVFYISRENAKAMFTELVRLGCTPF